MGQSISDHLTSVLEQLQQLPAQEQLLVADFVNLLMVRTIAEREATWFWSVIDFYNHDTPDRDASVMRIVRELSAMPVDHINLFADVLSDKLKALDTPAMYEVARRGTAGSADGFLYARCAAVARGREFYENLLEDTSLFPVDGDAEQLLGVAEEAHSIKTGESDYPHTPRSAYETRFNKEAWGEKAISFE